MCSRTWRANSASAARGARASSLGGRVEQRLERRLRVDDDLPARRAAGRRGRAAACGRRRVVVTCSTKSQYASIPADSTTFRSCISPQAPRTSDARSAVVRLGGLGARRGRSTRRRCAGAAVSAADVVLARELQRLDLDADLLQRLLDRRDERARPPAPSGRAACCASSRNDSLLLRSASAASAFIAVSNSCRALASSATFSAPSARSRSSSRRSDSMRSRASASRPRATSATRRRRRRFR